MMCRETMLFVIVFLFVACGIPSDELLAELNAPRNLVIVSVGGTVRIRFDAYNPEPLMTGYNVYMHVVSENQLRLDHSRHVSQRQVNKTIQKRAIVLNSTTQNYPTIQEADTPALFTARQAMTTINYEIRRAPNNQFLGGIKWFLAVSAYASNNIESELSNIVQIP